MDCCVLDDERFGTIQGHSLGIHASRPGKNSMRKARVGSVNVKLGKRTVEKERQGFSRRSPPERYFMKQFIGPALKSPRGA